MAVNELRPGSKVEIWLSSNTNNRITFGENANVYVSKVIVADDQHVDMEVPTKMGKPVMLQRNVNYSFVFMNENTMHMAEGQLVNYYKEEPLLLMRITLVTRLERFQRRAYYRLPIALPLEFQVVRIPPNLLQSADFEKEFQPDLDEAWLEGTTVDISGGGLRFQSEAPIMDLPYLYCQFELNIDGKKTHIGVLAKTLDRQPVPRSLLCTYRCKFLTEKSIMQENIVKFIFFEQRRMRKRQTGIK